MTTTITLLPTTVTAINEEMRRYEAREVRLLLEISNLHKAMGAIRVRCVDALKDCMRDNSIQAVAIRRAIEIIDTSVPQ